MSALSMQNESKKYNLFNILLNDDSESLENFLQNYTDGNDGVNSRLEKKEIPINNLKYDQRTKIKMISSPNFYSYGENIPIISVSALFGSINCFQLLLMCDADIEISDTSNRLPVHFACAGGCIEICDILDSMGADFSQTDKYNCTCLHYACMSGNVSLVERFWARNFDLEAQDANLMKPIHFASLCNNFLEEDENDFRCLNDGGDEVFDYLINKECEIDAVTKNKSTPFTLALRNSPSVLNYLIEENKINDFIKPIKKSKKSTKETNNNDIMADFVYNPNAFDDMLKNINNNNNKLLNEKEEKKEKSIKDDVDFIDLNNFYISDEDEEDQVIPLIDACRRSSFGIVAALLKRNKDCSYNDIEKTINSDAQKDKNENDTISNSSDFMPLIDVEKKDAFGWPPILYAAERGSLNITKLLVKKGANVNATSNNGFSPLLAAKNRNHPNIALFLEKNGALLHP